MNKFYAFIIIVLRPFFFLFHPYRVVGRENIPAGGALVCPNHTTVSDPFFVAFAFGRNHQLRIMAKAELMRVPVVGWLLKKAGIFGVERGKSDVGAIKQAMKCLKNGEKLLIFPEGTRIRKGREMLTGEKVESNGGEPKTGAAMLALRTGVPIIPVWMPEKKRWFAPTPVVIGAPFYPETGEGKAGPDEYRAVADEIMARIFALGG